MGSFVFSPDRKPPLVAAHCPDPPVKDTPELGEAPWTCLGERFGPEMAVVDAFWAWAVQEIMRLLNHALAKDQVLMVLAINAPLFQQVLGLLVYLASFSHGRERERERAACRPAIWFRISCESGSDQTRRPPQTRFLS